jgi:hypothetical protein
MRRGAAYTGASLNPARSFAVCVILGSFTTYHWIYWIGPATGSLLAVSFYLLIRKLEYWTVIPDVDHYETKIGHDITIVKGRAQTRRSEIKGKGVASRKSSMT